MSDTSPKRPLRLAFAGTPEFAAVALGAMVEHGYTPQIVLTQPDRRAGRGRELQPGAVKMIALEHNLPVFQPQSLKDAQAISRLEEERLDLMIVVAYGLLLPLSALRLPHYGCWNIHASLLPRWRGAAPIQRCIEAGDERTGVSIMQMAQGLDTGPVFLRSETKLRDNETGSSLHDRLALMGADALLHCLDALSNGVMPTPMAQDDSAATYAHKLSKAEARIDWSLTAVDIERKVRAFNAWPVCWTQWGDERVRIWSAQVTDRETDLEPGTRVQGDPDVIDIATGKGVLRITELQRPGKKRQRASDYINAMQSGNSGP